MDNEDVIKEAAANHEKHYRMLIGWLKRKKKNAYDLGDMIGEGAQVAHYIWREYGEED